MSILILLLALGGLAGAETPPPKSQEMTSLEERMADLEKRQVEILTQLEGGQVKAFLDHKISLGGFFETAILHLMGPDTDEQTSVASHGLGINLTAHLAEKMRFISQILNSLTYAVVDPHNNPSVAPGERQFGALGGGAAIITQGYLEYIFSPAFVVQTGIGYTPFGYAYQQRELPLFVRRGGPQLVVGAGTTTIGPAFPLWMGVHVLGEFSSGERHWGYNLYTFTPTLAPKTMGVGGRLWAGNRSGWTLGVSSQTGRQLSDSYVAYGTDLRYEGERAGFTAEYIRNFSEDDLPALETYYLEPYFNLSPRWLIYYVADYMNNPLYKVGAVDDHYKQWRKGGGVNFLPNSYVRYRLGFLVHDYVGDTDTINRRKRQYNSIDLSCGVSF